MAASDQFTDLELMTLWQERFRADLLALVLREDYAGVPHIVIHELLALTGILMRGGAVREPASLPTLLDYIERLRVHVQSAGADNGPTSQTH